MHNCINEPWNECDRSGISPGTSLSANEVTVAMISNICWLLDLFLKRVNGQSIEQYKILIQNERIQVLYL